MGGGTVLKDRTTIRIECHPVPDLSYCAIGAHPDKVVRVIRIHPFIHPISRCHLLPCIRHAFRASGAPSAASAPATGCGAVNKAQSVTDCASHWTTDYAALGTTNKASRYTSSTSER